MKFGFDIDEVVCNLHGSLLSLVEKRFGLEFDINVFATYNFYENDYTDDGDLNYRIADFLVDAVNDLGVLSNCAVDQKYARLASFLHTYGYEIHFITARNSNATEVTNDWLKRHKIPSNSLTVMGYGNDKGPIIKSLELDYYVDDHVDNVEAALECDKNLKGCTFLVDKPWNSDYINKDVIRVSNEFGILKYIMEKNVGGTNV